MGHITQHKIKTFYNEYGKIDVTFNKNIIATTKLLPGEVFIKLGSKSHPCIMNSTSMIGARIIIQVSGSFFEDLNQFNKKISLRLAFRRDVKSNIPLSFFIKSRVDSFNALPGNKPNLFFLNIEYTQKPPDDLIEILGGLLDVSAHAKRRKSERILLSVDVVRKMKLKSSQSIIVAGKAKKKGILRDLSFLGVKVITAGKPESFIDQEVRILFQFEQENILIPGKVVRCENIKERQDFIIMAVEFYEGKIPMIYTKTLSDYLNQQSITDRGKKNTEDSEEDSNSDIEESDDEASSNETTPPDGSNDSDELEELEEI